MLTFAVSHNASMFFEFKVNYEVVVLKLFPAETSDRGVFRIELQTDIL